MPTTILMNYYQVATAIETVVHVWLDLDGVTFSIGISHVVMA